MKKVIKTNQPILSNLTRRVGYYYSVATYSENGDFTTQDFDSQEEAESYFLDICRYKGYKIVSLSKCPEDIKEEIELIAILTRY